MAFTEFLVGKRERMSWIAETGWATGGTMSSGEVVGLDVTIEPDWSQGWQEFLTAGADDLKVQGKIKGPLLLPYTMDFIPVNWVWLKYIMDVADADDSGIKTHTFTERSAIASWKLEWAKRKTTNHVVTTIGNFVKSATMTFAKATDSGNEGHVKIAMDCVGQNESEGSSVTSLSNISKTPFLFRHVKVTLDGVEYKEVNNGEMTIDIGVDEADSRYCSTTYANLLGEPIPKIFRISGTFNINVKDTTIYDLFAAGVVVSGTCSLLLDRDGSGDDQILFTFSNFFIDGAVAGTNLEGVTNTDVVWTALGFTSVVARDDIASY